MQIGFKSSAYPFLSIMFRCPNEMPLLLLLLNNNTIRHICMELLLLSVRFAPFAFVIQHQFHSFASKMHSTVHIFSISIIHTVNVIEFIHTKCTRANWISIGMRTVAQASQHTQPPHRFCVFGRPSHWHFWCVFRARNIRDGHPIRVWKSKLTFDIYSTKHIPDGSIDANMEFRFREIVSFRLDSLSLRISRF